MSLLRQAWAGLRLLVVLTVVLGIAYPLAILAVGRMVPGTSDGSYATDDSGRVVGSTLVGQQWDGPQWFHSRPSAVGYDAMASGGSNLAASSPELVAAVEERRTSVAAEDGVDPASVPPDALLSSGSGLDPHISPAYAQQQVARVAAARGLDETQVRALVDEHVEGPALGFIGEPRVNVLALNLALVRLR